MATTPSLEQQLVPVKAMNPKPIVIIYGLNLATHGACNEINWQMWAKFKDSLTGVYAADVALEPTFHKALKTADNKIIKFLFGGLEECMPRMVPDSQTDALKKLIIEYVDNVQKQWKPFLLTGMQTGIIPQVALMQLVRNIVSSGRSNPSVPCLNLLLNNPSSYDVDLKSHNNPSRFRVADSWFYLMHHSVI
eukprot:scaffold6998_cov57-Attheya_sp.AAC.4